MTPVRAGDEAPPAGGVGKVRPVLRPHKDEGGGAALIAREAGIEPGVEGALRLRHIAGGGDEAGKVGVGHVRAVNEEGADRHGVRRPLLRPFGPRALAEHAAGQAHHPRRGVGGIGGRGGGQAGRAGGDRLSHPAQPLAGGQAKGDQNDREEAKLAAHSAPNIASHPVPASALSTSARCDASRA